MDIIFECVFFLGVDLKFVHKESIGDEIDAVSLNRNPSMMLPSQVKQTIEYFRNLESESSQNSPLRKLKKLPEVKPVLIKIKKTKSRKTRSLKQSNLSTRFGLLNVYEDIFGSGRNKFRGVPNRSALVEALATFPRTNDTSLYEECADDNIRFELFKKKIKFKKRKSLKSVFDINF